MQIAKKTGVEEKVRIIDDRVSRVLGRSSATELHFSMSNPFEEGAQHLVSVPELAPTFIYLGDLIQKNLRDPAMKVSPII